MTNSNCCIGQKVIGSPKIKENLSIWKSYAEDRSRELRDKGMFLPPKIVEALQKEKEKLEQHIEKFKHDQKTQQNEEKKWSRSQE